MGGEGGELLGETFEILGARFLQNQFSKNTFFVVLFFLEISGG